MKGKPVDIWLDHDERNSLMSETRLFLDASEDFANPGHVIKALADHLYDQSMATPNSTRNVQMRSNEWEDPRTRIQNTRDRAAQIRATAAEIRNSRIHASMLKIAKTYDSTADLLERILSRENV